MHNNIPNYQYETDVIIGHILLMDRASLLAAPQRKITLKERQNIDEYIYRRTVKRIPISQLICSAEFYGYSFYVDKNCLTPRPETECMVSKIIETFQEKNLIFADWCSGSGCIALSILAQKHNWHGYAIEASAKAMKILWKNTLQMQLMNRLHLWHGENPYYAPITPHSLDFISCNPPYIPQGTIVNLMPEVRDHEPHRALDGGKDGLHYFRIFLPSFTRYIKNNGYIFLETDGPQQIQQILNINHQQLKCEGLFKDYFGVERFMIWRRIA